MPTEAQIGELLVGSYLRMVEGCELVSYNQRSRESGEQMEIDVIGVDSEDGRQTVYVCEVVTHLRGTLYSGKPDTDRWKEFGGDGYQHTLERLWEKFSRARRHVREVFDGAERYVFQFWSPVVPEGLLTQGLGQLKEDFEERHPEEIQLIINGEYTSRINELRELAGEEEKKYGDPAFRLLQILEHLR